MSSSVKEYLIAWLAALPLERAAASAMFDETYAEPHDFVQHAGDTNGYEWGRIHNHKIVLTSLPFGRYGKVSAATTLGNLIGSLPHLKTGLMVGIGGGIPGRFDLRLGDVVIGVPEKTHGGVIQYDLGKIGAEWELKGTLNTPPDILLSAVGSMQAKHELSPPKFTEILETVYMKHQRWAGNFKRPIAEDRFYKGGVEVVRQVRNEPYLYYGTIASGDTLVKNENFRDLLIKLIDANCSCIEREAAGILNKLPSLVVRGICDYANAQQNHDWQRYAAAVAAACAKELLLYLPQAKVEQNQDAKETIKQNGLEAVRVEKRSKKVLALLQSLNVCPYAERKDRNPKALEGTCKWVTQHTRFMKWRNSTGPDLLWISADPGTGKSTLSRHLIDNVLNDISTTICYFFFRDDFEDQRNARNAICSIISQLVITSLDSAAIAVANFARYSDAHQTTLTELWQIFLNIAEKRGNIVCIIDGLDECDKEDRARLIELITEWLDNATANIKFLLTSRPHQDIKDDFYDALLKRSMLRLGGDNDGEVEQISSEIDIVTRSRMISLFRNAY